MITPQTQYPELGREIGISDLWLKREDLHPYKSHKGRSVPHMIDMAIKSGSTEFAISSSGNAALAAALHLEKISLEGVHGSLHLEVFVGLKISQEKLSRINAVKERHPELITITHTERPLQAMFQRTENAPHIHSLRQSTDDTALIGYHSLCEELDKIHNLAHIFVPTSSGTAAQTLAEFFSTKNVTIHIVQTSSCHPIAQHFFEYPQTDEVSIADAIVDKTAYRKEKILNALTKNGGTGIIVNNEKISGAQELMRKYANIEVSPNGALGVAGLMEATYTDFNPRGAVVCLVCGL
jgi:threonine synthase